jgi:uncharacterized membrane protein
MITQRLIHAGVVHNNSKHYTMKRFFSTALFLLLVITINGQFVEDKANFFSDSEIQRFNKVLSDIWTKTSVEFRLYTIDTLNGNNIKEYGLQIAKEKPIGKAGLNNGILLLLSKRDREVTILVGYGMEWIISDSHAQELINELIPYFKRGDYYEGIGHVIDLINLQVSEVDWNINAIKLSEVDKELEGKIIEFAYSNSSGSSKFKYAIETDTQFDEDFKIKIDSKEDFSLYYSKYMNEYISSILTLSNIKVIARLVDYNKRKLELLGILK